MIMNRKIKCMEYYFDSNKYNESEVLENMVKKKLEFPKKKMEMTVSLNKYGTYVVKLSFINNEIAIIKHIKRNNKNKVNKQRVYGQYRETKKYAPI